MVGFYSAVDTRARVTSAWTAWSRLYSTRNIIGTVSQSGGVPNGALIESGSNANGRYERYADGSQKCSHLVPLAFSAGSLMFGSWSFPATFISSTDLVLNGAIDNDTAAANLTPTRNELGQLLVDAANATTAQIGLRNQSGATAFSAPDTVLIHMTAQGRWF